MYKNAGYKDDVSGAVTTAILGSRIGLPLDFGVIGDVAGIASGRPTKKDIENMDKYKYLSYVPGVGNGRIVQRMIKAYADAGVEHPRVRASASVLNKWMTPALFALLGAVAGGIIGHRQYERSKKDGVGTEPDPDRTVNDPITADNLFNTHTTNGVYLGAAAGAATGGAINAIAGLIGAIKDKRKNKDIKDDSIAMNLIPGYGMYDQYNVIQD